MCGRYTQTAAFDELALRFGITVEETGLEDLPPRYNVAPSQSVPIVVAHNGGRRIVMAKWGFHPAWMKDGKLAPINAKAETVAESRLFQDAVQRGRCLVPADGFYEWKPVPGQKRKQPFYARLKGGGLFAFAGLYTPPIVRAGFLATFTIITTTPNELLAPIHNRMTVGVTVYPLVFMHSVKGSTSTNRLSPSLGARPPKPPTPTAVLSVCG